MVLSPRPMPKAASRAADAALARSAWGRFRRCAGIITLTGMLAASGQAAAQIPPAPSPETSVVKSADITVLTGSVFQVGEEKFQVAGLRAPRPDQGQCLLERLRGREARKALRRIFRKGGEIRIERTGRLSRGGNQLVRVMVDGQSLRRRLLELKVAVPRIGNETRNPWCIRV